MEWQCSVKEQLSCLPPSQSIAAGPSPVIPKVTDLPTRSEASIPESGFHSPGEQQGAPEDSMSSAATGGSPETVRTLQPPGSPGADGDSQDGSLLKQYLCSVQRQEEEEDEGEGCTSLFSPIQGSEASSCPDGVDEREENTLLKVEMWKKSCFGVFFFIFLCQLEKAYWLFIR